ncbi:RHS repeat domain-containing protein [Sphingomonas sp. 37zxx]|uniref:RHS repeat domain-containing protein n=1 Tax=Sphingomonas sp. 37zxx TaxID=1550073 RepID=UPI00068F9C26|nr:RHS repeat-associated core domain-containing protein [Sphingomonas sp. 37zxx]
MPSPLAAQTAIFQLTYGDGFFVTYDYDTVGALTFIRENGGLALARFDYDALGRRSTLTRGNGTVTRYGYDAASRLSSLGLDLAGGAQDLLHSFTHNPAGQIASRTQSNAGYAWTGAVNANRNYAVNALNQYTQSGAVALGYDGRGNLTQSGSTTYSYTLENMLATAPGASLAYDPLGRLFNVNAGSANTSFTYDGADMLAETNQLNGAMLRRYVYGPGSDEPLVWYEGGERRYLHADERGSVVALTNDTGAAIATNSYDEFGIPAAGNIGRFQYTGQKWIAEIGLYDYKARMYSPTLGRFLQTDPIGYGDGLNWYDYIGADPINNTDPSGLSQCPAGTLCAGIDLPQQPNPPRNRGGGGGIFINPFPLVKGFVCLVIRCNKKRSVPVATPTPPPTPEPAAPQNEMPTGRLLIVSKETLAQFYLSGIGGTICLSGNQFRNALSQFKPATDKIPLSTGGYARGGNSYGSSLGYALGGFTILYNASGKPVGLRDSYDFNSMDYGDRDGTSSWLYPRENTTRAVGALGDLLGAQTFDIRYPCS